MTRLGTFTHTCPGCDKPGVPNAMFACKRCWFRLPKSIRDDINLGWRHDRALHANAATEATAWYAAQTRKPPTSKGETP